MFEVIRKPCVISCGKIELPYPSNAPTLWWNGKCFQWNDTSQIMEEHLYFQNFAMCSVFRSNLITITLNRLWISTLTNIKSICVTINVCIGAFGTMIGSPFHSIHELFPCCTWYNISGSYALDLYFDAFDARSIVWCNGTFNSTTRRVEGLTIGIDVLPMIGGQSKSIKTTCSTNDVHDIILIIEKNVPNSWIFFLWNNYNCSL
jgi:hypothetical protein